MDALVRLQELGYEARVEGANIKLSWRGAGKPDPEMICPLLEEIRTRKNEALEYLRQTQAINLMSLKDFQKGFHAIRVWSKVLGREVWFVSHDRAAHELGVKELYFTGRELAHLVSLTPSPGDLKIIVEAKEALGGKVTGQVD